MDRKNLILAAFEIMRRNSSVPSFDPAEKINYQRQRRPGNDFLDWAIDFLTPLNNLDIEERRCLYACYYPPINWQWSRRKTEMAGRAIDKFWGCIGDDLVNYGVFVVSRL